VLEGEAEGLVEAPALLGIGDTNHGVEISRHRSDPTRRPDPLPDQLLRAAERRGISPANAAQPHSASLAAGSVGLRYLDWGGPAERPVVFVHGGALTAHTWDFVCLALRARYRCYALELRGHGESDWAASAQDYTLEGYSSDIQELLAQLGVGDAVLVGHSLGGQAALISAASTRSVTGLVLVDVGPEPHRRSASAILNSIRKPEEFTDLEAVVRRALELNPRRNADELAESLWHNLRKLPSGKLTWKYDPRAFEAVTADVLDERADALWRAVAAVECPTLIVRGADSRVFDAPAAERLQAELREAAVSVVADAGHTVQGDNPAGLVRALETFLARCFA
jgi:pimeloyl-ACP methyl ester carboxylesterase